MSKLLVSLAGVLLLQGCMGIPQKTPDYVLPQTKKGQEAASFALAEGATGAAMSSVLQGASAINPGAWIALAGAKVVATSWVEQLPEGERHAALHRNSSWWGGSAVCNLLMMTGAGIPGCVAGGVLSGLLLYSNNAPSKPSIKQIRYVNEMDFVHQ